MQKILIALFLSSVSVANARRGCDNKKTLEADIIFDSDSTHVDVEVEVSQCADEPRKAEWKIKVKEWEGVADCPIGRKLNWHVHAGPIGENDANSGAACQSGDTSGHYDPTFGCGGASEYTLPGSGFCASIGKQVAKGDIPASVDENGVAYTYDCNSDSLDASIAACEVGDLNGKMDKIDSADTKTQKFDDELSDNIAKYIDRSIVLHCCTADLSSCSPRVACADFKEVLPPSSSSESSDCPYWKRRYGWC
jgi:hypothetical protein